MILNKRFWYFFALICTLSTLSPSTFAQQNIDITSIKVDELSDEQIAFIVRGIHDGGLSEGQVAAFAMALFFGQSIGALVFGTILHMSGYAAVCVVAAIATLGLMVWSRRLLSA